MKKIKIAKYVSASFALISALLSTSAFPDPYPPYWDGGAGAAVHYAPVAWPNEPALPSNCGATCGDWLPYMRFQNNINDPRTQDPSNGGTAPQNYVNISSSCTDKSKPSIYYSLRQGATASQDVIMFRWRVEQIANTYATGPSAGNFGATDPWNSALWSVLFDVDGDGYLDLAAHLDGSSGAPSVAIDRIAGIWSKRATQSLDYVGDPTNVKLLGHNPTAFIDGNAGTTTNKILNFHNSLTPDTSWPNGSGETTWDYGTTRAKLVSSSPCNEYFIDYQIPVAMLDASRQGGPKIVRTTPISMVFCTANSLNNPFQKDCAINKDWIGEAAKPAPFGDYVSFNQSAPYSQPIVSSVTGTAPTSCPGNYSLTAKVQDTLAVIGGVVTPTVKAVKFYYYYDANGNGLDDDGNAWTFAANATLKTGSLNIWTASWDASSLAKGQYLIGVQAVDDNTKVDDGMTASGVDNRTLSYVVGDASNRIYVGGTSYAAVPTHSPVMTTSGTENWWGNPNVTGAQTALIGVALNTCGQAPTLTKSASVSNVAATGAVDFTLTVTNPLGNAITLSQLDDVLPAGFTFSNVPALSGTLAPSVTTGPGNGASGTLTWTFAAPVTIASAGSATLTFRTTAPATPGSYNNSASATTSFGTLSSAPVSIAVDSARVSLSKTPNVYLIDPDGTTQLVYTLAYSNDSTVSVTGATISDVLPAGVTYVSCTGGSACSNTAGTVTWTLGTLAGGASGSATLRVTVNTNYSSASLANSATLSATDPGNNPVTKTATSTIAVNVPHPNIVLQKTASTSLVAPGSNVTFTISYANNGSNTASSVVITDVIPSGFTYVSSTGSPTSPPSVGSGGTMTWNIGSVTVGASGSVSVTLKADNPYAAPSNPQTNTASVTWSGNGTPVTATSTIGVSQTGSTCSNYYFTNTTGNVGSSGTQNLANTTTPTGATATISQLQIPVSAETEIARFYQDPASTSLIDFTGGTSTLNGTLNYTKANPSTSSVTLNVKIYDYNPGNGATTLLGTATHTDTGTPTPPITLTGATLTGSLALGHRLLWVVSALNNTTNKTPDIILTVNSTGSTVSLCAPPPPNLTLTKVVDKVNAAAGDTLAYTVNFSNTSQNAAATGAQIVDTLPTGLTYASATLNGSAATPTGSNPYTFSVNSSGAAAGTVAAGGSGTLIINATVDNPLAANITSVTNSASLSSTQTAAVTATALTGITGRGGSTGGGGTPALAISLAADRTTARPGDTVTYTVTVVNIGTASASNVVISDVTPGASYYVYGTCTGCTNTAGTLGWNVGTLAIGASASYTFTMAAGSTGLPAGVTVIPDTATTSATGVAVVTSNTVNVSINGNPNLTLSKTATPNTGLKAGDTITYSMTVTNNGNASASNVVVLDPIPANTSYQGTITATAGTGAFDTINNRVVFNVGTLAAAGSATLSFKATVGTLAAGNTTITNNASATAANAPATTASATAGASAAPVLTLSKTAPSQVAYPAATLSQAASGTTLFVNDTSQISVGQYVKAGGTTALVTAKTATTLTVDTSITATSGSSVTASLVYGLSYQNTGDAKASAVTLTDTLPAGLSFISASGGGVNSSGTVTWNLGDIDAGGGATVQVIAMPTATGPLTNNASITCAACNTANASTTTSVGGLKVTKRTSTPTSNAGGTANYVIDVENTSGSAIAGVNVTDTMPTGFSYASTTSILNDGVAATAVSSPTVGDAALAWTGFTIQAGKKLSVSFVANIAASAGAATYQNAAGATPTASTVAFDPLVTTAEDVTILAAGTGVVEGYVFKDNNNNGSYDAATDTPLTGIRVSITDSSTILYTVTTDASGYFSRVVAAGSASVDVIDADLPGGVALGAGFTDPATVTVPNGSNVVKNFGYVAPAPDLTLTKSHTGNFTQGQTGATYTLTVTNSGNAATNALVSVVDTLPAGLTATGISGTGWTCVLLTVTCTRNDALAASSSYPAITVTVTVAGNAATPLTNTAAVSGGGETNTANNSASDPTIVNAASAAITGHVFSDDNGNGVQDAGESNLAGLAVTITTSTAGTANGTTDASGNYSITVPTGSTSASVGMPAGYTLTTANNPQTVTVISGGTATTPVGFRPPAAPTPPDLAITKSHTGNFTRGQSGAAYQLTVSNAGNGASVGTVTVADTLPAGLSATAMSGSGWTCVLASLTCTRSDALAPGASYPSITLTVSVAANAGSPLTNTATVSGGGETVIGANNTATDPTTIVAQATGTLSGFVFADANDNGSKDSGEAGIPNVRITLSGTVASGGVDVCTVLPSCVATSDSSGAFAFANVPAGTYKLVENQNDVLLVLDSTNNPRYTDGKETAGIAGGSVDNTYFGGQDAYNTIDNIALTSTVLANSGGNVGGYLFGERLRPNTNLVLKPPIVSGYIWMDRKHDRSRPPASTEGQEGWTVTLTASTGATICVATSDANGFYQFDNLHCPGYEASGLPTSASLGGATFSISFSKPSNRMPNMATSGGGAGTAGTGQITGVTLKANDEVTEQNLPLDPSGIIYNSATRLPVNGATIVISGPAGFNPATDLVGGAAAQTQVTGADGLYSFFLQNAFPSGTYTLTVTSPAGYLAAPSTLIPACSGTINIMAAPNPALIQGSNAQPPIGTMPHDPAACPASSAGFATVAPFTAAQSTTQYYTRILITNGVSAPTLNNHIPLDPVPVPPTVTKSFSAASILQGTNATLTLSLGNSNASALTLSQAFTDNLPAGMSVATPAAIGGNCTMANVTAAAGSSSITYANGALIPVGGCTITVAVTAPVGCYTNTIPAAALNTNLGANPAAASAMLCVTQPGVAPTVTKSFSATSIVLGTNATLTLNLGNANALPITLMQPLTDALPAGLAVATPAAIGGSCAAASVSAVAGSTSISYANGAIIPAGGCTITVPVTSAAAGCYTNTIAAGALITTVGSNAAPTSAALCTTLPGTAPTIAKSFSAASIVLGTNATLTLNLGNSNATPVTLTQALTDNLPAGLILASPATIGGTCPAASVSAAAGGSSVRYASGASIPAGGCTITVPVTGSAAGCYTNTIPAGGLVTSAGSNPLATAANLCVTQPTCSGAVADVKTTIVVPSSARIGAPVSATVSFGNTGTATALGVTYSATLSGVVSNVSCSGAVCSYNSATGALTLSGLPGTLAPGESYVVTVNYISSAAGTVSLASSIATQSCQGTNFDPDTALGSTVIDNTVVDIPTLSPEALALLMLAIGMLAMMHARRSR